MKTPLQRPPSVPWQVTGNHWLAIPCIHPADGSIHAVGLLSRAERGAVELSGSPDFLGGTGVPLLRLEFEVDGRPVELGAGRMAWQRVFEWLPTFTSTTGEIVIRGTVFAPAGPAADFPGMVYAVSVENRGAAPANLTFTARGAVGAAQVRVRTPRSTSEAPAAAVVGDVVAISAGASASHVALAFAGDGMIATTTTGGNVAEFTLVREASVPAGRIELAIYAAAGPEQDGAVAMVSGMRERGWQRLASATRDLLGRLQQSTGVPAADRLVNRHLMFAYFYAAGRAIDDGQWYLFRSRSPWCAAGVTIRDYESLMWLMPALQLAEPTLAHELLVRLCELHGYAPGRGVNYMDGAPFDVGFCLDALAAYPVAVDRYVAQTGDDRIVEDAPVAEALYAVNEDLAAWRNGTVPLYRTEIQPSGADAPLPYTLHGNALAADALDVLRQTLDEKTAESVQSADAVRAAIMRQFATEKDSSRTLLSTASDLAGATSMHDDPVGSVYWLPLYHMLSRDDSVYRRTVRRVAPVVDDQDLVSLAHRCATLMGADAAKTLDWLRRADLDNGLAAELLDERGAAVFNGGDATLSALVAYTVWYVVSVLGVAAG